jgi:hypothetical protein
MTHITPAHFLEKRVNATLVGCGGNGSQMLTAATQQILETVHKSWEVK